MGDAKAGDLGVVRERVLLEKLVVELCGHHEVAVLEFVIGLREKVAFRGNRRSATGRAAQHDGE
jgi:hypothetical protein